MRALIVGGAGFVGSHLVAQLREKGHEVYATFRHTAPSSELQEKVHWNALEVSELNQWEHTLETSTPDCIYYLSGVSSPPDAEKKIGEALDTHVLGIFHLFSALKRQKRAPHILYVSTGEVYGRAALTERPLKESSPRLAASVYGITKMLAEDAARRLAEAQGVRLTLLRPFNHTGAGQSNKFVTAAFAEQLAKISRGIQPPEISVGNLEAIRDFSDVRDIVRGYALAAHREGDLVEEFLLGSGSSVSIRSILSLLIELSGISVKVVQDPLRMRPAEVPEVHIDRALAEKKLGWRPELPLQVTLSSVYDYWAKKVVEEQDHERDIQYQDAANSSAAGNS